MKVFAHRGNGIPGLKENTIEAFRAIQSVDIDGIELDVHFTKDEQWIVNHDFFLYGRLISKTTSQDLEKLANNLNTSILYLSQALKVISTEINVECKTNSQRAGFELAKYLDESKSRDFFISSFKIRSLRGARSYDETTRISFISALPNPWQWKKYHHQVKLFSINPLQTFLIDKLILKLLEMGVEIHAWTVNDPHKSLLLDQKNVTAVITDDPMNILTALSSTKKPLK